LLFIFIFPKKYKQKERVNVIIIYERSDSMRQYEKSFKKRAVELVKKRGKSTTITAESLNIPLKTFEKWITAYNKDNTCFDENKSSKSGERK